jgi:hypothetical protein
LNKDEVSLELPAMENDDTAEEFGRGKWNKKLNQRLDKGCWMMYWCALKLTISCLPIQAILLEFFGYFLEFILAILEKSLYNGSDPLCDAWQNTIVQVQTLCVTHDWTINWKSTVCLHTSLPSTSLKKASLCLWTSI